MIMIYFFKILGYNFLKIYKGGDSNDEVAYQAFPQCHAPDPGSALCRFRYGALIQHKKQITDNFSEKEVSSHEVSSEAVCAYRSPDAGSDSGRLCDGALSISNNNN